MKRKHFFSILGVTLGVVGLFYYRHISSPEYSLGQIKKSFKEHDLGKFEKYVDSKRLASGILDKTLDKILEESTATSESGKLGEELGVGILKLLRPQVEEIWAQQISKLVETGEIQGRSEKRELEELWNKSSSTSFRKIGEVKKDGKVATVSLEFYQPRFDTILTLEVKLRDKGSYWQLFDISNLFNYRKTIDSLEEIRINALNLEVEKEFFRIVKVSNIRFKPDYFYHLGKYLNYYYIDFENLGEKEIEDLTVFYDVLNTAGEKLVSGYILHKANFLPNQKFTHEEFEISETKADSEETTFKPYMLEITFKDGTKLEWNYPWDASNKENQ